MACRIRTASRTTCVCAFWTLPKFENESIATFGSMWNLRATSAVSTAMSARQAASGSMLIAASAMKNERLRKVSMKTAATLRLSSRVSISCRIGRIVSG